MALLIWIFAIVSQYVQPESTTGYLYIVNHNCKHPVSSDVTFLPSITCFFSEKLIDTCKSAEFFFDLMESSQADYLVIGNYYFDHRGNLKVNTQHFESLVKIEPAYSFRDIYESAHSSCTIPDSVDYAMIVRCKIEFLRMGKIDVFLRCEREYSFESVFFQRSAITLDTSENRCLKLE